MGWGGSTTAARKVVYPDNTAGHNHAPWQLYAAIPCMLCRCCCCCCSSWFVLILCVLLLLLLRLLGPRPPPLAGGPLCGLLPPSAGPWQLPGGSV
jgi:hypothetical protein